ncbi:hypothetical protein C8Q77DRAFT_1091677 [Trametes polyzona]|nr:hypothetical protein C8Q77DRAFT_1091677 [Trametes polyzona]
MTPQPLLAVDDTSPAIVYEPASQWLHADHKDNVMNGTYSAAYANATATFVFNGTSVALYGVDLLPPDTGKPQRPPVVTFILDGEATSPQTVAPETQYAWLWFKEDGLDPGEHKLVARVDVADPAELWPFILDYIQYTPVGDAAQSQSAAGPTASVTDVGAGGTRRTPAGLIAGVVVAGVVGLALLALAIFLLLRRRKAKRGPVTPFPAEDEDLLEKDLKSPPSRISIPPSTTVSGSTLVGGSHPPPSTTQPGQAAPRSYEDSPSRSSPSATVPFLRSLPGAAHPRTSSATTAHASAAATAHSLGTLPGIAPPISTSRATRPEKAQTAARPQTAPRAQEAQSSRRVFHTDSGIRFVPPPEEHDAQSEIAFSEVPPEYTER